MTLQLPTPSWLSSLNSRLPNPTEGSDARFSHLDKVFGRHMRLQHGLLEDDTPWTHIWLRKTRRREQEFLETASLEVATDPWSVQNQTKRE